MPEEYENPASRLLAILSQVRQKPANSILKKVWGDAFGIHESKTFEIFHQLIMLSALVDEVEREIRLVPAIDHKLFLKYFPGIRQMLSISNLDQSWQTAATRLDEATMTSLHFCSESLSRCRPDRVSTSDLESLRKEIDDLFNGIQASDLNKELKAILSDLAESMRRAVAEYRLRGVLGMREELFLILEKLQRNYQVIEKNKDSQFLKQFWKVFVRYDTVAAAAVHTQNVLTNINLLLGSG
jgi:hypothetical protein